MGTFLFLRVYLILFDRKSYRERRDRVIFYVLVHSHNSCNGRSWASLKAGQELPLDLLHGYRDSRIWAHFPVTSRELDWKNCMIDFLSPAQSQTEATEIK